MTDPDELLEVYDPTGHPTGQAKPRGLIHREGDWHLAFFCWIVRAGRNGPELVLQRRALSKDVWPGRFDASAAGHVRFGEPPAARLREVQEELGLVVDPRDLVALPVHHQEHRHPNGIIDREHHDLHLLRCDLPLEQYRPNPREVSGLAAVPASALVELVEGARESVSVELVEFGPDGVAGRRPLRLRREDVVPYDDGYHRRLAQRAAELIARGH